MFAPINSLSFYPPIENVH